MIRLLHGDCLAMLKISIHALRVEGDKLDIPEGTVRR